MDPIMSIRNVTVIQDDPLLAIDPDEAIQEFENFSMDWYWAMTAIIKFFVCLGVIAADSFMIITICRNKKLKTKTDRYILNYFVLNLLYLCTPIFWLILEVTPIIKYMGSVFFCMFFYMDGGIIYFCHLFSCGLALDWLLMVQNPNLGRRFQKLYSYSVLIIYIVGLIVSIVVFSTCYHSYSLRVIMREVVYTAILIFVIVCNYLKYRTDTLIDNKKSCSLTISNIMLFSWTPLYIYDFIYEWLYDHDSLIELLEYTFIIPDSLSYVCPILVIVMLGKLNKHYKMAYDRAFRRNVRNYEGDEESLEESEETKTAENSAGYANITAI